MQSACPEEFVGASQAALPDGDERRDRRYLRDDYKTLGGLRFTELRPPVCLEMLSVL